jgi:hypothetical protein
MVLVVVLVVMTTAKSDAFSVLVTPVHNGFGTRPGGWKKAGKIDGKRFEKSSSTHTIPVVSYSLSISLHQSVSQSVSQSVGWSVG